MEGIKGEICKTCIDWMIAGDNNLRGRMPYLHPSTLKAGTDKNSNHSEKNRPKKTARIRKDAGCFATMQPDSKQVVVTG